MSEQFDPYYTWLGIPKSEQPADHYRLLGIQRFEENREVISHAADQRMAHVRSFQTGPSARDSQRVLNELSKAAGCLLNPRRKNMYDQHLQSQTVTTRTEEAQHPPQKNSVPVVTVRPSKPKVSKPNGETKLPARAGSPTRRRKQAMFLGSSSILAVGAAIVGWILLSGDPAAVTKTNDVSQANAAVLPGLGSATALKPSTEVSANRTDQRLPSVPATTNSVPTVPSADVGKTSSKEPLTNSLAGTTPVAKAPDSVPASSSVPATRPATPPGTVTPPPRPEQPEIPIGSPKGLQFHGSDRIELANTVGLIDFDRPFTIETWIRFAPETSAHWIAGDLVIGPNHKDVPAGNVVGWQMFIQQTQNGRHRLAFSTQEGYAAEFPVANGWHHLAVCGDGKQLLIFVDGRRSVTSDVERLKKAFKPSPLPIHIGSHPYMHANQATGFSGDLRAFRISSLCRYNANFEPGIEWAKDTETQVLFDFPNSSGERLADISGHARDGKLMGPRWTVAEILPTAAVATSPMPKPPAPAVAATAAVAATVADSLLAIPSEVALVQAREQMRKVLQADFTNLKEPKEQGALCDKLVALAAESSDDLAGKFAMLEEAYKLAALAGDLSKSLSIVDALSKSFKVDAPKLKVAVVTKCEDAAKTTADRRRVAEAAVNLLDDLIMLGRFDAASEIAQTAVASATKAKDAELSKTAREYRDEIAHAKKRWNEARDAEAKLATDKQNSELNLRWGRFLCFYQRNWAQGLPHLVLGNQEKLVPLAKLDLANPKLPEEQAALGQAWADSLKNLESSERPAAAMRALHWFRQAEAELKGLAKANVEKQMKELETSLPGRLRPVANKTNKASPTNQFQPPREYLGALGRIQVNGVDAAVLWKYDSGLRLTNQSVLDILSQVGVPRGKMRMEFAGLFHVHESMTVNITQLGGSGTGTAALFVDNKPLGEVGGMRATSDIYKVELNPGEHTIRWVLTGDDFGSSALNLTNAATAQAIPLYHNPAILNVVRETPTRARLNVNMTRS